MTTRLLIMFVLTMLVELYFLQAVNRLTRDYRPKIKKPIRGIAVILGSYNLLVGITSLFYHHSEWNSTFTFIASFGLVFFLCKTIGCIFLLIDDLIRLFRFIISKIFPSKSTVTDLSNGKKKISRIKFFSQLAVTFTVIPFISFIYGMTVGAFKYKLHKASVNSPNLPDAFDGLKIIQISDMHLGSFVDKDPLKKAFQIALDQKPDIIVFTGDLVNNVFKEAEDHVELLQLLKAPLGVYSILGNHDYGDYVEWETEQAKTENLENLKQVHAQAGWKLLLNEHVVLEKGSDKIALLGVENWSNLKRFPRYGKLAEAHANTESYPFKILLSHDPSHWDAQIKNKYGDIDLTLSGHTHGFQFGIEIPGIKWSPSQYMYKQWAGLYKYDNQYLYVNRGLGFVGYPGRLGIWPEITLIELHKA